MNYHKAKALKIKMTKFILSFAIFYLAIHLSLQSRVVVLQSPAPLDSLSDNPRLSDLHIKNYGTIALEALTFTGLESLKVLNMTNNDLSSLKGEEFEMLEGLECLALKLNNITSIPSKEFNKLRKLKTIQLDENALTTVDKKTFSSNTGLETISMRANDIGSIHYKTFATLLELRELDLSFNRLRALRAELFKENHKLERLDVSSNSISHVDSAFFTALTSIEWACFEGNLCVSSWIAEDKIDEIKKTLTGNCSVTKDVEMEWMVEELKDLREENRNLKSRAIEESSSGASCHSLESFPNPTTQRNEVQLSQSDESEMKLAQKDSEIRTLKDEIQKLQQELANPIRTQRVASAEATTSNASLGKMKNSEEENCLKDLEDLQQEMNGQQAENKKLRTEISELKKRT